MVLVDVITAAINTTSSCKHLRTVLPNILYDKYLVSLQASHCFFFARNISKNLFYPYYHLPLNKTLANFKLSIFGAKLTINHVEGMCSLTGIIVLAQF